MVNVCYIKMEMISPHSTMIQHDLASQIFHFILCYFVDEKHLVPLGKLSSHMPLSKDMCAPREAGRAQAPEDYRLLDEQQICKPLRFCMGELTFKVYSTLST